MLKRILSVILTVIVLSALLMLVACGDNENEPCETCVDENGDRICDKCEAEMPDPNLDGKIVYTVKVVNADGDPLPNMIVTILNGEEKVGLKMTNEEGTVSCSEKNVLPAIDKPYTDRKSVV